MQNEPDGAGCWDFKRDCTGDGCLFRELGLESGTYWDETKIGAQCGTDWYDSSKDVHGNFWGGQAPALLGFDDDIKRACNSDCDGAKYNILRLFSNQLKYNTCRNFEWQVCAAQGKLRSQAGNTIKFAVAPKDMDLHGDPPFGCCNGWTDTACSLETGFANDDIYYLEVCLFSMICANRKELFEVDALDDFACSFDAAGFDRLRDLLVAGPRAKPGSLGGSCDIELFKHSGPCPNHLWTQCGGKLFVGTRCCEEGACQGDQWYMQCRPT